jgi:hypothetical protein
LGSEAIDAVIRAAYNCVGSQKPDVHFAMEDIDPSPVAAGSVAPKSQNRIFQFGQFGLHTGAVYLISYFLSVWLAGRFHEWVVPLTDPRNRTSTFQFMFSHVFAFAFIPALLAGFVNSQYRRMPALFVWIIPAIVLAYEVVTFPTTVFQNHYEVAFQHYFSGGFFIGEFRNFSEMFAIAANPDVMRGVDQQHITGSFYAGVGYSLGAFAVRFIRIPALAKLFPSAVL